MPRRPGPRLLEKWRTQGSLRYLAHELGVTTKQVTRYWDAGWIEGAFLTPKGHRRIRYTSHTVERVRQAVHSAKRTNIAIRYHLEWVTHRGTRISVKGCRTMRDVYRRLRRVGVGAEEARRIAHRSREAPGDALPPDLAWDALLAYQRVSRAEVNELEKLLAKLPAEILVEPCPPREFRTWARQEWRTIVSQIKTSERLERIHGPSPERQAWRQKIRDTLGPLLRQPDHASFVAAFHKLSEPAWRILDFEDADYRRAGEAVAAEPQKVRLEVAALHLRQSLTTPSAAALARELGISRPALYRAYGTEEIRKVLRAVRGDAVPVRGTPGR